MSPAHEKLPGTSAPPARPVAVVAIGRNEGQRMVTCLRSALQQVSNPQVVIYVDSGSTDGSLERARELGVTTLALDMSQPFTAARARNFGFAHVMNRLPHSQFIQFLDADCEMMPGWINAAVQKLSSDEKLAGVAGVLRERLPDRTVYNKLCDMEWQAPAGETRAVGGNAMLRTTALEQVGGYNPSLIAGEEPEMCLRLRERGWRFWRLPAAMATHDAAMTRFGQWWKRAVRFGYAQTEVSRLHRLSPHRIWARETRSTIIWSLAPPILTLSASITLALTMGGWWWLLGLLPLELYDVLALKIYLARRRIGQPAADAALYAAATTLSKFAQLQGLLLYLRRRRGARVGLIEYKRPSPETTAQAESQPKGRPCGRAI